MTSFHCVDHLRLHSRWSTRNWSRRRSLQPSLGPCLDPPSSSIVACPYACSCGRALISTCHLSSTCACSCPCSRPSWGSRLRKCPGLPHWKLVLVFLLVFTRFSCILSNHLVRNANSSSPSTSNYSSSRDIKEDKENILVDGLALDFLSSHRRGRDYVSQSGPQSWLSYLNPPQPT
jgi:hypothetical protein